MKKLKVMLEILKHYINEGCSAEDTPSAIALVSYLNYLLMHGDLADPDVQMYITLCNEHGIDSFRYLIKKSKLDEDWLQKQREKLRQMPKPPIVFTIPVRFPVSPPNRRYSLKDKILYSISVFLSIIMVAILPFVA